GLLTNRQDAKFAKRGNFLGVLGVLAVRSLAVASVALSMIDDDRRNQHDRRDDSHSGPRITRIPRRIRVVNRRIRGIRRVGNLLGPPIPWRKPGARCFLVIAGRYGKEGLTAFLG